MKKPSLEALAVKKATLSSEWDALENHRRAIVEQQEELIRQITRVEIDIFTGKVLHAAGQLETAITRTRIEMEDLVPVGQVVSGQQPAVSAEAYAS